jgi:2-succinyl-6-hydroxy-2,4-cyclohexadiene-1-carboxylate synthase
MPSRRIVLAHGFTQTARSWEPVAERIRERLRDADIVAVDMPGHGSAADIEADLWTSAARLVDIGGRATYVGYSMGGRVALHAALAHPASIERLVLIGATAGIDDPAEREARLRSDHLLAEHIDAVGVGVFIDEWLATPLFARLTASNDQREDRLRNTAEGLSSSLRSTGTGAQQPLWEHLREIEVPVLVMVGQHDTKFAALGERLVSLIPRADMVEIASAGHSVHLEAPVATADEIVEWIRVQDRDEPGGGIRRQG